MEDERFKVVPYKTDRFAVIDPETGEIIEDGNGYGFKTKQNAVKSAYYHFNKGTIDNENSVVVSFMKKNRKFGETLAEEMFMSAKHGEPFGLDEFRLVLSWYSDLKLPMEDKKFFNILKRKSCKW